MTFNTYNEKNNDIFTYCSYRQNIYSRGYAVWDAGLFALVYQGLSFLLTYLTLTLT